MSFIDETMKRTNIQALREFLLYGDGQEEYTTRSYEERLKGAYKEFLNISQRYDDSGEDSELFSAMNEVLTEHEHIYMEIGIQTGFLLAKDIFASDLYNDSTTVKYKEMYTSLFAEITRTLELLQEAQRKTEEMYVGQ